MEPLPVNVTMQTNKDGFTLIEVLIAMAILSIALMTLMKATSQNIRDNSYLQDKTSSSLVGTYVMNSIRVGLIPIRDGDEIKKETELLGRKWPWQATLTSTPHLKIKKIKVDVYHPRSHTLLTHLESFLYVNP